MPDWLTLTQVRANRPTVRLEAEVAGGSLLVRTDAVDGDDLVFRADDLVVARESVSALRRDRKTSLVTVALHGLVLDREFRITVAANRGDLVSPIGRVEGTADFGDVASGRRRPLAVVGAGRSGTTYLMRLLREHPAIAVVDEYPFESRHALVLLHQLLATAAPNLHGQASLPTDLASPTGLRTTSANPFFIERHAHFDYLASQHLAARVRHTQELVDAFYDEVDRTRGGPSTMFAEKFVPFHLRNVMGHVFTGSRTLVLLRDPRDTALSQVAFNDQRGFEGFGLGGKGLVERTGVVARAMHSIVTRSTASDRGTLPVVLRYEDLVADPRTALGRVLHELDAGVPHTTIDAMVHDAGRDQKLRKRHMTARSAEASVGRWRRAVSKEDTRAIAADVGPVLAELGYPES